MHFYALCCCLYGISSAHPTTTRVQRKWLIMLLMFLARSSGVSHDAMNAEKAGVTGGVLMESGDKKTTRDFYKTSLEMKYLPYQRVQDLFQQYGYHICIVFLGRSLSFKSGCFVRHVRRMHL